MFLSTTTRPTRLYGRIGLEVSERVINTYGHVPVLKIDGELKLPNNEKDGDTAALDSIPISDGRVEPSTGDASTHDLGETKASPLQEKEGVLSESIGRSNLPMSLSQRPRSLSQRQAGLTAAVRLRPGSSEDLALNNFRKLDALVNQMSPNLSRICQDSTKMECMSTYHENLNELQQTLESYMTEGYHEYLRERQQKRIREEMTEEDQKKTKAISDVKTLISGFESKDRYEKALALLSKST